MKKCPQCGREYDLSMMFCLDDGAELLYGPASMDEPATAILSEPGAIATGFRVGERTLRQVLTTEQTAVFSRESEAEPLKPLVGATERHSLPLIGRQSRGRLNAGREQGRTHTQVPARGGRVRLWRRFLRVIGCVRLNQKRHKMR